MPWEIWEIIPLPHYNNNRHLVLEILSKISGEPDFQTGHKEVTMPKEFTFRKDMNSMNVRWVDYGCVEWNGKWEEEKELVPVLFLSEEVVSKATVPKSTLLSLDLKRITFNCMLIVIDYNPMSDKSIFFLSTNLVNISKNDQYYWNEGEI